VSTRAFLNAVAEEQDLLTLVDMQVAVGDHFTIADAAIVPFLAR
jgi:glutathione S-transferase